MLYQPVASATDRCAAIATEIETEIAKLDAELGGPATEMSPAPTLTKGQRAAAYDKKLAIETVKGYVQPIVQTKCAIMNDDEKDRRATEAADRGAIRRAYRQGLSEGIPCTARPPTAC